MERVLVKDILAGNHEGAAVLTGGWVRSKRVSKNFAFVVINDGSCQGQLQCVVNQDCLDFSKLGDLLTGACVSIQGDIVKSPGKGQAYEMQVKSLNVEGPATADYPLQKKGHSLEFLRDIMQYRGRTNTFGAMFRVRNAAAMAIHNFFQKEGFIWAHTPVITSNDCEGAGELFHVTNFDLKDPAKDDKGNIDFSKDFFGKPSYLTVSGQLQGEVMALSHGRIYTFGPTFRAENSNTSRHLAEFWMVEPEMVFCDLNGNMDLAENFLKSVIGEVLEKVPDELSFFEKHYKVMTKDLLTSIAKADFHRMSYTDAVDALKASGQKFEFPVEWGLDLQSEHEKFLTDKICGGPVIVYDYPRSIKPFYMRINDDGKTVAAMDVLVPQVGEIIGGSQREERMEVLQNRMTELDVDQKSLDWYLDLRRNGSVYHAGFGLGFERLIQYVTGMGNIRDVIPFPRAPQTINF